jgi:ribose 5-phosphate isomerase B
METWSITAIILAGLRNQGRLVSCDERRRRAPRDPLDVRIAFGTDERTAVTDHVQRELRDRGHEVVVAGEGTPWPDVGRRVGELVASGQCDLGVVCCWTGTGVSIAANKVPGVRAALCTDAETARGARRWNDANVLAFGLRLTSEAVATELLDAFLDGQPDPSEADNIAKVT